jgi:von Willebrand factor type A domain
MQTTRIILIDISSSMDSPFEGRSSSRRQTRSVEINHKFKAAKQYLLSTIANLQIHEPSTHLTIIAFASMASVIYTGSISNREEIDFKVSRLYPNGSATNLASALELTIKILNQSDLPRVRSLDVITDGLSNQGEPFNTAHYLREEMNVFLYIYLISNTDEGYAIASRLVGKDGGRIEIIECESNLLEVGRVNNQTQQAVENQFTAAYQIHANSLSENKERAKERPKFSIVYPETISFDGWHSLFFWIYNQEFSDQIKRKINKLTKRKINRLFQGFNDRDYESLSLKIPTLVPEGSLVKVSFSSEKLKVNPESLEFEWLENLYEFSFRIKNISPVSNDLLPYDADLNIRVSINNLIVLNLPLILTVNKESSAFNSVADSNCLESVFAAYSESDKDIVEDFQEKYKALGISMFTKSIHCRDPRVRGEALQKLFSIIESSDVFQLFWSNSARQCSDVGREWEMALNLIKTKRKHSSFFKGVYWENPIPLLPFEIANMEFHRLHITTCGDKEREEKLMKIIELQSSRPIANITNTAIVESKSVSDTFNIDQSCAVSPTTSIAKDDANQQINISSSIDQSRAVSPATSIAKGDANQQINISSSIDQSRAVSPATSIAKGDANQQINISSSIDQGRAVSPATSIAKDDANQQINISSSIDQSRAVSPATSIAKDDANQQINISSSPKLLLLFEKQGVQELFETMRQFFVYNPRFDEQQKEKALHQLRILIDLSKKEKSLATYSKATSVFSTLRDILPEGSSIDAGLRVLNEIVELFDEG